MENAELYAQIKQAQEALRHSEQQIRELATELIHAHEEKRQRAALEVHDRILQPLVAAHQQIQTLQSKTWVGSEGRQVAERALGLVQEAINDARNIMNDLYPAGLAEFGLIPLMAERLGSFEEDTGCMVAFDADCPERSPRDVEITIYRIFHEALTKVRRHAPIAKTLTVSLTCGDRFVVLQVQDDGPGFDLGEGAPEQRVGGLMSMRRRAGILGGTFDIRSTLGRGSSLTVSVPIKGCNS